MSATTRWTDGNLGPKFPRLLPDVDPATLTREEHDMADALMRAALAEVGYFPEVTWSEELGCYLNVNPIPWQVLYRARELVLLKLGQPYHWEDDPAGGVS